MFGDIKRSLMNYFHIMLSKIFKFIIFFIEKSQPDLFYLTYIKIRENLLKKSCNFLLENLSDKKFLVSFGRQTSFKQK